MKDNLYIILKVNFQTLGNNVIHNTQHNTYRDCEVKLKWLLMVTPHHNSTLTIYILCNCISTNIGYHFNK